MIDLDAIIAAEVRGETITVQAGGALFELIASLPFDIVDMIFDDPRQALAYIAVEDGEAFAAAVLADHPTQSVIFDRVNAIYQAGESAASSSSSGNGSTSSRPTSSASTVSISAAT